MKISLVTLARGLLWKGVLGEVIRSSVVFVSNMQKPSWCLVVKTTYFMPASFAAFAQGAGSNCTGLKVVCSAS